MAQSRWGFVVGTLTLASLLGTSTVLRAAETPDWLRGSGKDLEVRLQGQVVTAEGRAVADLQVASGLDTPRGKRPLAPRVEGNRFEVWIPVNQGTWYRVWLKATSASEQGSATRLCVNYELRQAAPEGLTLTLQKPTRQVKIAVVQNGQPVPDATVKAVLSDQSELQVKTDANGKAHLLLFPKQTLSSLTAWAEDFRIGGYSFSRKPDRDANADTHVVELSPCRDLKVRFEDEAGKAVANLPFHLEVATAPPHYNFIGSNDQFQLTSDAQGEATFHWLPDWKEHFYYAELDTSEWVLAEDHKLNADGVAVFPVKKCRARQSVPGQVKATTTSPGGFYVTLMSFQSERKHYSDPVWAFSDAEGRFSVDVLPDATYCGYVQDARWVSDIVDLIPYQSSSNRVTATELTVSEGQEVTVQATRGPEKRPYADLAVSLCREHSFSWREGGQTHNGTGGPQWWVTTDASGRATARTLPGKLSARVYTPQWQAEESVEVRSGQAAQLLLHRQVETKQKVTGRLLAAEGLTCSLGDAEVTVIAMDEGPVDQQTLKTAPDGSFAFETFATEVGLFACTQENRAAGWLVTRALDQPLVLRLDRTQEYRGRLLSDGDQPLAGHGVRAVVCLEATQEGRRGFRMTYSAKRIEAKTDDQGHYCLQGVPCRTKVSIQADGLAGSEYDALLDRVYLEPEESRPLAISHLGKKASSSGGDKPLAERLQKALRDGRLSGYHTMVLLTTDHKGAREFANQHFVDYETNKEVAAYMQVAFARNSDALSAEDAAVLTAHHWQLPGDGQVHAYALDGQGQELGRLELEIAEPQAAETAAAFVRQYAPPRVEAEKKWEEAFAEAQRSQRRVWVRISGRYCGPCHRLTRWLDDQRALLDRDYVMLKIDEDRDQHAAAFAERLTQGKHQGIPFFVIFEPDGTRLVDSEGPLGNMGFPSSFDDKKYLRTMLLKTRQRLSDAEIEQLLGSLGD